MIKLNEKDTHYPRGRIEKAIRLLGEHVTYISKKKRTSVSYKQICAYYRVNMM